MSVPPFFQMNTIYCGDNRDILRKFPENSVDLIYADPPFFSNKQYEVIWDDGYEIRAFKDRWKGGIQHYISWMRERVEECYRVLNETGLFYLHCDWHAGHYLKVMCDEIFGLKNFRNEIVYCYSGGGIPKRDFPRKHDTIFRYSKGKKYTHNRIYRPYTQGTLQRGRTKVKGKHAKLRPEGTPVTDWWTDVKYIHSPTDKEKLGYPTQKSEELLERVIISSSNEGDLVLDPFCGCGTAIAVAHKTKRNWVGIDVSPTACKLMAKRMRSIGVKIPRLMGMPMDVDSLRILEPFEFQNWVITRLVGRVSTRKTGDMGIDGYTYEGYPVQVKQSENIGRNVVDNFETAIRRAKKNRGVIVAFSFGKGAYEEIARAKNVEKLDIEAITVEELLKNRRNKPSS